MTDLSPAATEPPWKLAQRLENLPIVLAGPIVRHAVDTEVTVWLALKRTNTVRLTVHTLDDGSDKPLADGTRATVAVGRQPAHRRGHGPLRRRRAAGGRPQTTTTT
jgi:hypothetical protein